MQLVRSSAVKLVGHVLALLALLVLAAAARAETRFTVLNSSTSSWVARGYHDYTVSPAQSWLFTPTHSGNTVHFEITGAPLAGTDVDRWFLTFAAPGNAPLAPGVYANFQRWPFNDAGHPGLEFGSTGRLDNQAAGSFEILDVTFGPAGEVNSFAANFTHYGEANPTNWAMCELRYNSSVPGPGAAAVVGVGLIACARRRRG